MNNQEEVNEINFPANDGNTRLSGQLLRLDLYRLISYFQASEMLTVLSTGEEFCPWQALRDEFEGPEIIRILLQTAVSIRFIARVNGDDDTRFEDRAEREEVGIFFKAVGKSETFPLTLRDACDKIIQAESIVLDSTGNADPYREFLKPRVLCFEQLAATSGWKAEVNIVQFVEVASSIASLLS